MSYYLSHGIASTVLGLPFCWLADKHKFWVVDKSLIIQMWSFHDDRWCMSLEVWDSYPSIFIIPPSKTCEKMYTYIYKGSRKWRTVTVKSVDSDSVNIQQTPGCHVHVHSKPGFFSTPIVPPAATIRASTVTGLWKGLYEVNALLGTDFPYSPVKCSPLSHKSKKTIAAHKPVWCRK